MTLGDVLIGVAAALVSPFWIRSRRFRSLLLPPPVGTGTPRNTAGAIRAANAALRRLGRLQRVGAPWRNTCLSRSVAGCLVLRYHHVPAVIRLGARSGGSSADVSAHAWVESVDGAVLVETPQDHTMLVMPGTRA